MSVKMERKICIYMGAYDLMLIAPSAVVVTNMQNIQMQAATFQCPCSDWITPGRKVMGMESILRGQTNAMSLRGGKHG